MKAGTKWVLAIAALAVGLFIFLGRGNAKSDQLLIQESLDAAIQAGREGRPGSVLEQLSNSFEINGMQIANRAEIARYIRDQRPDVSVENTLAQVQGDSAVIESPVTLKTTGLIKAETTIPNVKMEFLKEQTTRWLVFPDKQWKLVKVTVPAESWMQWAMGF